MAKKRGINRDRPIPKKLQRQINERLAPDGALGYTPEFEETIQEIVDGQPLNKATLEQRFPGLAASPAARREFLMLTIFNLRLRGIKQYKIAEALGIHRNVVGYYVKEMAKCFEKEIAALSFTGQLGRSVAVFRELQAQAGVILAKSGAEDRTKLRALREMAFMEHSIIATLQKGGFFANGRLNPIHSQNAPQTEVGMLQNLLTGMFTGGDDEDEGQENELEADFKPDEKDISVLRLS